MKTVCILLALCLYMGMARIEWSQSSGANEVTAKARAVVETVTDTMSGVGATLLNGTLRLIAIFVPKAANDTQIITPPANATVSTPFPVDIQTPILMTTEHDDAMRTRSTTPLLNRLRRELARAVREDNGLANGAREDGASIYIETDTSGPQPGPPEAALSQSPPTTSIDAAFDRALRRMERDPFTVQIPPGRILDVD